MNPHPTEILGADAPGIERAAGILRNGGLVAFPTETVYGLGADAASDSAVAKIFAAKGRPTFNPLIAHISDAEMAPKFVRWERRAEALAAAFWPGALTLVLPLAEDAPVSRLVTAGLPSLAIRVPDHPVAVRLLQNFGGAVAAPSANPSGRISPSDASHVLSGLEGRVDAVIDGGPTKVGVESSILSLLEPAPRLLRPGGVTQQMIEEILGESVELRAQSGSDAPLAPGQLLSHYAPRLPVRLEAETARAGEFHVGFAEVPGDITLSESGDLDEAARTLFAVLHMADQSGAQAIAVAPIPAEGIGAAINDRLRRAAAPRGNSDQGETS